LKVTDQMPAYGDIDVAHLFQCFLYLVLANVVKPDFVRGSRSLGSVRLCYRDDGDSLPVPASCDCRPYSRLNVGYAVSQAGKSHSGQI